MEKLKECEAGKRCRGLSLFSFLIKPIQRICKYPLLLRDLLKHTPPDSQEFQSLTDASKKIEAVVEYINEGKRHAEQLQKIYEIQESIEGADAELVEPTRRFMSEGNVLLHFSENDKKKAQDCHVFLFNDLAVFAKEKSKTIRKKVVYEFKGKIQLTADTSVITCVDSCRLSDPSSRTDYYIRGNSLQETNKWVQLIKNITNPKKIVKYEKTGKKSQTNLRSLIDTPVLETKKEEKVKRTKTMSLKQST